MLWIIILSATVGEKKEVHTDLYRPTKSKIPIMLDKDIFDILKSEGKGYQTRINSIPREAIMGKSA